MDEQYRAEVVEEFGIPVRQVRDPEHLRALAHPRRIQLLDLLMTSGPLTATEAARQLGDSSGSCSYHLRQLARFGMVEEVPGARGRQRPWRWVPLANTVDVGASAAGRAARTEFLTVLDARNAAQVRAWREGEADDPWRDLARTSDWALRLTEAEFRELGAQLDAVVAPWARRAIAGEQPADGRVADLMFQLIPRPLPRTDTQAQPDA